MWIDPDICYRAVASRDPRFDGRFFTAVMTTGVYCRPVCPARTPRRENVRFFACAAAAEAAGFRPCMRCRPETAPGTPAWSGSAASVTRALRLIEDGFLDDHRVDDLAELLGMGGRHLRRLFDAHLGASPVKVAVSRRVHFARRLLDDPGIAITEAAFAAGFSSMRRFNDAFRKVFGVAPSTIRRSRPPVHAATVSLLLRRRPPYDAACVVEFLARRAVAGLERVDHRYRRVVTFSGGAGIVAVTPRDDGVRLEVPAALNRSLPDIVARTRLVFDLDADPLAIGAHLSRDAALAPLVAGGPGLVVPGGWDGFETLVRVIVGQQVSVAAARTLLGRIVARYGRPVDVGGERWTAFPTPRRMARARLERVGLTPARAGAVRAAARRVADGTIDLGRHRSPEETARALYTVDGIGEWTAGMVAMRALGDPDAFPAGDLGLRRAAANVLNISDRRSLVARAERWRPWRAYAAAILWRAAGQPEEEPE